MHTRFWFPMAALAASAALAAPANAELITIGSDLSAPANVVEAHGADSAYWLTSVRGTSPAFPADGQIKSIKVKGTVLREPGAAPPANQVHFQSLFPDGPRGEMKVLLTSAFFDLPIDSPNAISTFAPENLCVKKGGLVALNSIGGFQYGGSLTAPTDPNHYKSGAPLQIFSGVGGSQTAFYTADNGTNNGAVLKPYDQGVVHPTGTVNNDRELLMQVVLATGDDRSYDCGGPYRRPDGTIPPSAPIIPDPYMAISRYRGQPQLPYVPKSRSFRVGIVCANSPAGCTGTAVLTWKGKQAAAGSFAFAKAGFVTMKLAPKAYKALRKSRARKLGAVLTLTPQAGIPALTQKITLRG